MKKRRCPWSKKCRNGGDGCWTKEPGSCVRYLPLEGTNLTNINGIVETPPDIDDDKFTQYFMNWLDAMGWSFCGSFNKHEEEE
jgi:hypothetical protein